MATSAAGARQCGPIRALPNRQTPGGAGLSIQLGRLSRPQPPTATTLAIPAWRSIGWDHAIHVKQTGFDGCLFLIYGFDEDYCDGHSDSVEFPASE
jgi:hypothetical protein